MKKNKHGDRNKPLFRAILVSCFILLIFLILQQFEVKFLKLHYKWIIVSSIPILLALLIGGFLKTFKGFGIELEANLKEPLPISVVSETDAEPLPGFLKSDMYALDVMPEKEKRKINRLTFIYGKKRHYDEYASNSYLQSLKNLRFLEIVNEKGEFIYLIPKYLVFPKNNLNDFEQYDNEVIRKFIKAIENQNIEVTYVGVIKDYVKISDSLIDAYKKIKISSQNKITKRSMTTTLDEGLPVVNIDNVMIGIIYL